MPSLFKKTLRYSREPKKKDFSEYLDEGTRATIRDLFRDDFQRFGYPF